MDYIIMKSYQGKAPNILNNELCTFNFVSIGATVAEAIDNLFSEMDQAGMVRNGYITIWPLWKPEEAQTFTEYGELVIDHE